jgi:hypothetical protein
MIGFGKRWCVREARRSEAWILAAIHRCGLQSRAMAVWQRGRPERLTGDYLGGAFLRQSEWHSPLPVMLALSDARPGQLILLTRLAAG